MSVFFEHMTGPSCSAAQLNSTLYAPRLGGSAQRGCVNWEAKVSPVKDETKKGRLLQRPGHVEAAASGDRNVERAAPVPGSVKRVPLWNATKLATHQVPFTLTAGKSIRGAALYR